MYSIGPYTFIVSDEIQFITLPSLTIKNIKTLNNISNNFKKPIEYKALSYSRYYLFLALQQKRYDIVKDFMLNQYSKHIFDFDSLLKAVKNTKDLRIIKFFTYLMDHKIKIKENIILPFTNEVKYIEGPMAATKWKKDKKEVWIFHDKHVLTPKVKGNSIDISSFLKYLQDNKVKVMAEITPLDDMPKLKDSYLAYAQRDLKDYIKADVRYGIKEKSYYYYIWVNDNSKALEVLRQNREIDNEVKDKDRLQDHRYKVFQYLNKNYSKEEIMNALLFDAEIMDLYMEAQIDKYDKIAVYAGHAHCLVLEKYLKDNGYTIIAKEYSSDQIIKAEHFVL